MRVSTSCACNVKHNLTSHTRAHTHTQTQVFDRRINELRLQSKDPIFNSIGWSYSSSPREGCSMNSFSISSQVSRCLSLRLSASFSLEGSSISSFSMSSHLSIFLSVYFESLYLSLSI